MTLNHDPDAMLVSQARRGDIDAFPILLERYQPMAFCLAFRMIHEQETAHDLVQEAMLQAFLSLHRLQDDACFKSWLYGIVLNLCRNWLRRHPQRLPSLDLLMESELTRQSSQMPMTMRWDPQELLEKNELQQIVHDAVAVLSARNREVAYLFYYEDLSMQEIANRLGITLSAVKNRLYKGREQLRAYLQTFHAEYIAIPRKKRRKLSMIPLSIIHQLEYHTTFSDTFFIFLLDGQKKHLVPFHIIEHRMPSLSASGEKTNELFTLDLVEKVLQALNGKLQEVAIETLGEELLYAKMTIQGPDEPQTLNARLNDGLLLALRLHCAISISEEVFEQQAMAMADLGTTLELQIDEAARRAQNGSLFTPAKPANLDLRDGLRGWKLMAHTEDATYEIDPHVNYLDQASLALTLLKERDSRSILLSQEKFKADAYRGKRMRMRAYIKAVPTIQPKLTLKVAGPLLDPQPVRPQVNAGSPGIHIGYVTHAKAKPAEGSSEWMQHEMVINIPEGARTIGLTVGMEKPGKIWLNGLTFEAVTSEVPLTGTQVDPPSLTPLNLDFSNALEFWDIVGSSPDDYETGLEEAPLEQDSSSAYLKSVIAEPHGTVTLQQRLLAMSYRGKQLHLSTQIKTTDVLAQARLFVQTGILNEERMDVMIKGTTDWQHYEVTLPISTQEWLLRFGLTLHGQGQVWIKDIQMEAIEEI